MTSAQYLENFLDSLDYLPVDLKRNLLLLAELDVRSQYQLIKANENANQLLSDLAAGPVKTNVKGKKINKIQSAFKTASDLAEDKLQLANQSYELVDQFIRRLDFNMAKFKADITESLNQRKIPISDELREYGVGGIRSIDYLQSLPTRSVSISSVDNDDLEQMDIQKQILTRNLEECVKQMESVSVADDNLKQPLVASILDMAVLPNEPRYCSCNEVSYGDMVACDDAQCNVEWFHFECVGLLSKPMGKWFCAKCSRKKFQYVRS